MGRKHLYFRVSGSIGPGFSGAARFSFSRRAHVKATSKGTLDSMEQKNYAVGEQKVGQLIIGDQQVVLLKAAMDSSMYNTVVTIIHINETSTKAGGNSARYSTQNTKHTMYSIVTKRHMEVQYYLYGILSIQPRCGNIGCKVKNSHSGWSCLF